jgi:hypothetical protein
VANLDGCIRHRIYAASSDLPCVERFRCIRHRGSAVDLRFDRSGSTPENERARGRCVLLPKQANAKQTSRAAPERIMQDATPERGDVVITDHGASLFSNKEHGERSPTDFVRCSRVPSAPASTLRRASSEGWRFRRLDAAKPSDKKLSRSCCGTGLENFFTCRVGRKPAPLIAFHAVDQALSSKLQSHRSYP